MSVVPPTATTTVLDYPGHDMSERVKCLEPGAVTREQTHSHVAANGRHSVTLVVLMGTRNMCGASLAVAEP